MGYIGTGITLSGASSGAIAEILDVAPPNASRESINMSHMGTSASHKFDPADLVDWGEATIEVAFFPATMPLVNGSNEVWTMTFTDSATSVWTFTGHISGFEPQNPMEERATATITIKVSGGIAVT